jgi:hypothetical protein
MGRATQLKGLDLQLDAGAAEGVQISLASKREYPNRVWQPRNLAFLTE